MRIIKFLIITIVWVGIISCEKEESYDLVNPGVEQYIELLKAGEYDAMNLPEFTYRDIPALLQYRNETRIITDFPHNPISSFYGPECKLGMYVLWTIESIRAVSIQSEYLIRRFPSQNPILAQRNSDELVLVSDIISHNIVAQAYFDWWENNKHKDFEEFDHIDPLEQTDYKWH
ncbi:MAG: DUF4943 family protein [Bacteroidales bacterium]|nr:DUF4943 family protein [Bacteroidales bacterium]